MPKLFAAIFLFTFTLVSFAQVPSPVALRWFKGNTHAHTLNSDGNTSPENVAKWYRNNGYNFLVITDHEHITAIEPLNDSLGENGKFLVIPGQEVTDRYDKKPHHLNGLGLSTVTLPKRGNTSIENLQLNIDAIRALGGVPQINHPNFGWALTADTILRTRDLKLFELHNGHPQANNLGGGDSLGTERMWDLMLTRGKVIYGIASDDAHNFKVGAAVAAFSPIRGWVMVRAGELKQPAILEALERGDFYSSTGVELDDYRADAKSITIKIKEEKWSKYRVQFIGRGGKVLKEVTTGTAVYKITGNEGYVRAKILESNGKLAWTQPVFVGSKNSKR